MLLNFTDGRSGKKNKLETDIILNIQIFNTHFIHTHEFTAEKY